MANKVPSKALAKQEQFKHYQGIVYYINTKTLYRKQAVKFAFDVRILLILFKYK